MMGLEQLLMLVEEALLVMGLRLLLVCHSGEEYERSMRLERVMRM
jgi:hypothetical protein